MQVNATFVCPDGKYSLPGSDSVGDCVCPEFSSSKQNSRYINECICDAGYFRLYDSQYLIGGWYCAPCNPGQDCYNNSNYTCPEHSSSYAMAKSYLDCWCLSGFLNATARTEANYCEECPANSYCTGKGAVQSCVANAISPVQSSVYTACFCDLGWKGRNNSACVACQSPTYCYGGVQAQCSEGTYSPSLAWDRLNCSCIAGRWGPTGGPCIVCSAGKYNTFPGCKACTNTTDLDCSLCELGTASSVLGRNTTCDVCPAGKYSFPANQKGALTCEACANGTVSGVGSGNCTSCLDGWYAVSGASVCTQCAPGTYGGGVVSTCTSCPAGMYGIDGLDSEVRQYPPKVFDTSTSEVLSTFRGKPAYNQNITLSSTGISFGIGQYSLYYSSIYSTNTLMKSNLFTLMSTGAWGFGLYNTNGTYTGSASISDGYMGDWLVVEFPVPFKLTAYKFTTFSSTPSRAPGEWKIYGSNDGWNFTELTQASVGTRITTSHYTNQAYYKSVLPTPDANLYLGFVFNKLSGGVMGTNLLGFDDLILYGTQVLDGWAINNKCASCAAGKYSNITAATSSSTCASCSVGSYSSVVGATTAGICTICSAGKYSSTNGATACLSCEAGTYSTTIAAWNSTQCTPCSAGMYSTILGAPSPSNCSACLPGKISDKAGSVSCSDCFSGTYATIQSSTCTFCAQGTYSGAQASTCITCGTGYFSLTNASACVGCPKGSYNDRNGSGNCSLCNPGSYSWGSASICTLCGVGKYKGFAGCYYCSDGTDEDCTLCSPGASSSVVGRTAGCDWCTKGKYSSPANSWGASTCEPCGNGTFSFDGAQACFSCSLGTYAPAGSSSCSSCPFHTYLEMGFKGSVEDCVACNAGTVSPFNGAMSRYACMACDAGKYEANRVCTDCSAGSFSNTGVTACGLCENGTFSIGGAWECTVCARGRYAPVGVSVCQECPLHTYLDESFKGSSEDCKACPNGTYTLVTGVALVSSCIACEAGKYELQRTCIACAAGKFSMLDGQTGCVSCGYGEFSMAGSSACDGCPAGSYSALKGRSNCSVCRSGTFSQGGVTACDACAVGYYSLENASACSPCTTGEFTGTNTSSNCSLCNAGTYSPVEGLSACLLCAFGTFAATTGRSVCQDCQDGYWAFPGSQQVGFLVYCFKSKIAC